MNSEHQDAPEIALRIPGNWSDPGELQRRLPEGFRLTPDTLFLPDGTSIEFFPLPPDNQFPLVFGSACRKPAGFQEVAAISEYTINVGLAGPGGSMAAARTMMGAAAAIIRAGGAGVFIDNSALAHGGADWIEMADDGGPDAVSFAFASVVRGKQEVYSVGMHVLGFPDLLMHRSGSNEHGAILISFIRGLCRGDLTIDVRQILEDEHGQAYHVVGRSRDTFDTQSPMHNPLGRLKIVSIRQLADGN